jgi:hypothetical protein
MAARNRFLAPLGMTVDACGDGGGRVAGAMATEGGNAGVPSRAILSRAPSFRGLALSPARGICLFGAGAGPGPTRPTLPYP